MKTITCPTFFVHGAKDNLIPCLHSVNMKNAC